MTLKPPPIRFSNPQPNSSQRVTRREGPPPGQEEPKIHQRRQAGFRAEQRLAGEIGDIVDEEPEPRQGGYRDNPP